MIKAEKLRKPIKNIFYISFVILECGYQIHAKHTTKSIKIYNIYYTIILRIMITYKNNTKEHTTFSSQIYYDATNYVTSIILFNLFFLYLC